MEDQFKKRNQVYGTYKQWLVNAINDSLNASITGVEIDDRLGLFNMFHLQVQMRNEDYASSRPLAEDIECMREALFCKGVDTLWMEKIFPPSYNDSTGEEWEEGTNPDRPDGVDFMQVESDGITYPINRIR